MLTRAGTAPPPHVLRFRFALWRRKVQLHVAIAWFKLLVRAQGPLEAVISRWRTVAAAATRLRRAAIAWEHQPHPVQCQLSRGWAAWSVRWQEAARQRESARRGILLTSAAAAASAPCDSELEADIDVDQSPATLQQAPQTQH